MDFNVMVINKQFCDCVCIEFMYNVQIIMSALNKVIDVHRTVPILLDHTYVAVVMDMSFTVMDALAMVHFNC